MSQDRDDPVASRPRVREPVLPELPEATRVNPSGSSIRPHGTAAVPGPAYVRADAAATLTRHPHRAGDSDSDASPLHAGIDLGTSRSSICASNGRRATLPTVVGWPKDPIASKFLGKEIVFGEEVLEKRLSLDICFPLEAGVIQLTDQDGNGASRPRTSVAKPLERSKAQQAAAEFLRYLVQQVRPEPGQKVFATVGTPGQISATHKQALIEAASEAVDRLYLTTEPFAVAYSLESLNHTLIVDIGAGTTDLCRVHGSLSGEHDQKTLREAGNFIDQTLFNLLRQKFDKAQFTQRQVRQYKERFATVAPSAEPITVTFPVNGRPTSHDVTDEMRKACQGIVGPLVSAILELVGSYDPEFQAELRSNIWLAGGGCLINGLPKAIEEGLAPLGPGVRVRRVDDPVFAGADGALKLSLMMPAEYWTVRV